jgi:hypothetical protein
MSHINNIVKKKTIIIKEMDEAKKSNVFNIVTGALAVTAIGISVAAFIRSGQNTAVHDPITNSGEPPWEKPDTGGEPMLRTNTSDTIDIDKIIEMGNGLLQGSNQSYGYIIDENKFVYQYYLIVRGKLLEEIQPIFYFQKHYYPTETSQLALSIVIQPTHEIQVTGQIDTTVSDTLNSNRTFRIPISFLIPDGYQDNRADWCPTEDNLKKALKNTSGNATYTRTITQSGSQTLDTTVTEKLEIDDNYIYFDMGGGITQTNKTSSIFISNVWSMSEATIRFSLSYTKPEI